MTRPIISVEHLSKAYRLGMKEEIPDTFVGAATSWLKAPLRNWQRLKRLNTFHERLRSPAPQAIDAQSTTGTIPDEDILWALRDVSFEISEGEVVGIIGRNGAGKSTLLKILSRITEPTHGRAVIRGRVSSLLEVGTGFHPELTGRENIYMNGTILGMRKKEIDRKFDEIVDFSGVEKFLDTPIKRYSSGMQVRLAFAVAAHLEPEILIVDEVLAVGDAEFQKKCLGKMQDVAQGGRTVLFVSHQMEAMRRLCKRLVVMSSGEVLTDGDAPSGIDQYLSSSAAETTVGRWIDVPQSAIPQHQPNGARFLRFRYGRNAHEMERPIVSGGSACFSLVIESDLERRIGSLAVTLYDVYGTKLINADTISDGRSITLKAGINELHMSFQAVHLKAGNYFVGLWLANPPFVYDHIDRAARIEIFPQEVEGLGSRPRSDGIVTCNFSVS